MELIDLGINSKKINQFKKKGISTVEELLTFFPKKYYDFTKINDPSLVNDKDIVCFLLKVQGVENADSQSGIPMTFIDCKDRYDYGVTIIYFRQQYMAAKYITGNWMLICGQVSVDSSISRKVSIINPIAIKTVTKNDHDPIGFFPIYSKISGMSDDYLKESINKGLESLPDTDIYDQIILDKYNLISTKERYKKIHNPKTTKDIVDAKNRTLFDDLFYFNWMLYENSLADVSTVGYKFNKLTITNQYIKSLPYELTEGQKEAISGIFNIGKLGKRIHGLVQGDVGYGKTEVAKAFALMNIDIGRQVVVMTPTGILSQQHYTDFCKSFEQFDINIAFLSSETKKRDRKKILQGLTDGTIQILISTQSALSDEITFKNLGGIVVDEEHRFGVKQRDKLEKKYRTVHHISMSATPIPRTLAMAIYGDGIEVFTINTPPKNRKPVKTSIVTDASVIHNKINEVTARGQQVYVVCGMIDADDESDILSVTEVTKDLQRHHPHLAITSMTGKTKKEDQENIINEFKDKKYDVLVSTTVIEVGVNVPNTTLMVIYNSDRFGLAQLHQLRGRVGRSNVIKDQAECLLATNVPTSSDAWKRLVILQNNTNGYEIAQADLEFRGAGDFIGTVQSGENKYVNLMLAYPKKNQSIKELVKAIHRNEQMTAKYRNLFKQS